MKARTYKKLLRLNQDEQERLRYLSKSTGLNVKYTPDAGGEPYVIPPDYMGDAVTITMDAVAAATAPEITEEMYEQLDYLEKHPEENYYENEENFSQYDQGD